MIFKTITKVLHQSLIGALIPIALGAGSQLYCDVGGC